MAGSNLRLVEGQNIELTVEPGKLNFQTRKDTVREYWRWVMLVESLKMRYWAFLVLDAGIFLTAFVFAPVFLLLLVLLVPLTLNAQFNWGDKLDDKQVWESKFVTQVEGVAPTRAID